MDRFGPKFISEMFAVCWVPVEISQKARHWRFAHFLNFMCQETVVHQGSPALMGLIPQETSISFHGYIQSSTGFVATFSI